MARSAPDSYGSEGSVQTVMPTAGHVAPISAHASPEDFGGQVGQGIQKVGQAGEELAAKYGTMVNETLMTKADTDFATKLGQLKADYTSKTGMAAFNAFPQYQAAVAQAFQESRAGLPMGAQHGFDMLGARTMANHIADGSSYATSQLKEQQRDNYSNLANSSLQQLLDPDVAANPERSQYHLDTLHYAAQAQMDTDHSGLKTDPENGTVSFDEDKPEGKALKANFEQRLDSYLSQGYVNRYDTLAKKDVFGAYDAYQQDRSSMPKSAQVALDASFAPRLQAAHTEIAKSNTLNEAAQNHWDTLTNPSRDNALDVVQKNEGKMSDDGQSAYGIDKTAHPKEFAEISSLPESDRSAYARKFFKDEYYDKRGIGELPKETQAIVMDGAVNHTTDFGNKLIQDAKNGATPQRLLDERRAEYQRVGQLPGKEQYLQGWNNRLDNLQQSIEGKKTYATNENGAPLSLADYYRTHSQDILSKGDAYAEQQMPGDLALKRSVRESLNNYMTKTIANESAQHLMDNRNVMKAINGEMTKGKPPETEDELRSIPGMAPLLDKVNTQDPRFASTIPTLISKVARRNDVTNSANGYDVIIRTLQPQDADHPNHIKTQSQLDSLLGKSDGTGINMKDYNDAKPATEFPTEIKEPLLKHMQEITNANGNLDGKGQERAMQWYNQVATAYKKNETLGDKKDPNFASQIGQVDGPIYAPPAPSRLTQITNWAKELTGSGVITVRNPNGDMGTIPAANIEKALAAGYKKVE